MSDNQRIQPHKVTKPIQLLAAWLVGLVLVDGAFLGGAATISNPAWVPGALVTAAIVNVPLFLAAIFVLQTRFRPEMQEDQFYSRYLENKTGNSDQEVTSSGVDVLREDVSETQQMMSELVVAIRNQLSKSDLDVEEYKEDVSTGEKLNHLLDRIDRLKSDVSDSDDNPRWTKHVISVNKNLPNSDKIEDILRSSGIPIHKKFGPTNGRVPDHKRITIGDGFSVSHLRALLGSLSPLGDWKVDYAGFDEYPGEYDNEVLIGAYTEPNGIKLSKAISILREEDVNIGDFYDIIGRSEFWEDPPR